MRDKGQVPLAHLLWTACWEYCSTGLALRRYTLRKGWVEAARHLGESHPHALSPLLFSGHTQWGSGVTCGGIWGIMMY